MRQPDLQSWQAIGASAATADVSRRRFVQLLGVGSAGLISASALAACGSSGSPAAAKPSGGGAAGAPKRGGTLTFASTGGGGSSDTLNPVHAIYDPDLARATQLFDQPLHFSNKGAVQPGLIEEYTANKTATSWNVRLRQGVTFHNGKDLTADDLIYTLQQITNKKKPGTGAGAIAQIDVAGLKKLDKLSVQIPCTSPFSILPSTLCGVYYYIIPVGFDPAHPVGTGPFKFKSFSPGGESVFTRNENYWLSGKPYLDEIRITDFSDETSMLNGLLSGQVSLANLSTLSEAKQVQSSGGGYVVSKTGGYVPFVMEVDHAQFADPRIRTAMRLIVDRAQLNETVYDGLGAIGNDVFGIFDPLYDHSLPQRTQDLGQAKSLLKQAGASGLHLTLSTGPIGPGAPQAAQVFAQQAKGAGVTVTVQSLSSTAFYANTYLHRMFTQDYWFSKPYLPNVAMATGPHAQYNETHFHNPHYNQLFAQALATADQAKLTPIVHDMMQIDYQTGGNIIPAFVPSIDCFTKAVHGVTESVAGIPFNEYDFKSLWTG
jgi:peptide/nickel transport system substrate-binding protein